MSALNRRQFLDRSKKASLGVASGVTILSTAKSVRGAPANEKVIMAIVGCRGRGNTLAQDFASREDCEMAYVADVDSTLFESRAHGIAARQGGRTPKCVQDFRKVLDDPSVDAVVVATPTHWHALATVWSCQAGKDVFVEKPLCHNAWEGQQMVKAARKHNRVVQVGTQNRSAPYNLAARQYVAEGKLGKIHFVRVINQKYWANFQMEDDGDPPPGFDWDMWNGPAPEHAYNPTFRFHWHHLWRYCIGDLGNDGSHQFDLARMIVGFDLPKQVYCTGGRFNTEGAADTPDTQMANFTYDDMVVTLELTLYTPYMLKTDGGVRDSDMFPYWPQNATRIEIYGSEGVMYVGRMGGGWQVYVRPKSRQPVVKHQIYGRFPDRDHQQNFVQCVRSRERPNADIEIGHRSHLTLHYATMSYRLGGQTLHIDRQTENVKENPQAMELFRREYRRPWVLEEV